MAVTASDLQAELLARWGGFQDVAEAAIVTSATVTIAWNLYADKATVPLAPRLQYLYADRQLGELVLRKLASRTDYSEAGASSSESQEFRAVQLLVKATQDEIEMVESRSLSLQGGAIGMISTVEPVSPPVGSPNGNNRYYRGDLYTRWIRR